jgi:class 3 adenylate cyclase/tetratricopeptide (TPR) repeat protein
VLCAKCERNNSGDAQFCQGCGARLELICSTCATANGLDANFCKKCGTRLTASTQVPSEIGQRAKPLDQSLLGERAIRLTVPGSDVIDGERKTVTALFADIRGSTELMEDLDPEEARALIDPALKLMIEAVQHYGGHVVRSTGDGIFALFGAPVAHEDHPQRALYGALRLQEAMRRCSAKLVAEGGTPLEARVGINTGEVVVRTLSASGHAEYDTVGHTANLAARMEAVAPTGSIAISEHTRQLVEGYFQLRPRGPTRIKGLNEPVDVYEVVGLGPVRTRLQRAAGRGLTKFVGREREMETLRHAAMLAREGRGQIVAAMADPGVGKSRLFYEFKATSALGWMVLEALSISHGKASAYLPVIDLLRNYFEIAVSDDARKRREKVAGKIAILDRSLEDTLPYLLSLLGIVDGEDPLAQMDARVKKRRTLEAIKRILLRESLNQPLVVVFEDLHWMDSESETLLNLLADSIGTSRILLLVNYRPEYSHKWGSKTYYMQLRLDPLGKESAEEMLSTLLGSDATLVPLKRIIAEKTEGNPLFMEEICLSLFEDGTLLRNEGVELAKPLASLRIPPTVQGIIASRVDRLPADEKDLLQTVAVIGTDFNMGVARAVCSMSDDDLNRILNDLQLAEFIYEQPAAGDVEYTFKHALTHDVAYNSMLAERRKLLHERTAQAIETLYSERVDDHLTELAHHFAHSGNAPKAVEYLGRAGERAAEHGAHSEAVGYFTRALKMLSRLPDGTVRDRRELDLQMALSWSSFVARGHLAPEREPALVRARDLAERLGDKANLMEALLGLAHVRLGRSDVELGGELAQRVLAMGQEPEASVMLAGAHNLLGMVRITSGQFPAAREHFQRAVELVAAGPSHHLGAYFAEFAPNLLVTVLLILGYASTGLSKAEELLSAARRSSDPNSIAIHLFGYGIHHLLLRDTRAVAERADELLSIALEHEMMINLLAATFFRGWAIEAEGRGEEGIAEMRRSISDPTIPASAVLRALMLTTLAETFGRQGHAEEGLDLVEKGLAAAEQTGLRRISEAELHRIKAELLMIKDVGNVAEAEQCLRTAVGVARRQSARLFELRATVVLARLMADQGRRDEARTILAEIYNWFTEGFDTADLKEAKSLLDELSA